MTKDEIKILIATQTHQDGLTDTGIAGVKLFRATKPVPCAPAVYEPCLVIIVSGLKEAVLDGQRYVYDNRQYLCCPQTLPVQAGTPMASMDNPLFGVYVSLGQRVMTELTVALETVADTPLRPPTGLAPRGIKLANWDAPFTDALTRLLQLVGDSTATAILGPARLRELLYAVLNGQAGHFAGQAFSVGNGIARSIAHLSSNLDQPISIDQLASKAGMSRAVFHRKFKHATTMSPIQFAKSLRINNAAVKIASGMSINEAALDVGYVSPSQFSREFKRLYGQSPKQWSDGQNGALALA